MWRRKCFQALIVAAALPACDPSAGPAAERRALVQDAGAVVDPEQLVALVEGPGSADRLTLRASERGYSLLRRDQLRGLDLMLLTFRMPPGAQAAHSIQELEAMQPGVTVGLNHAYRTGPVREAPHGSRIYADELIGWPRHGCPARIPIGIIDGGLDADAPGLHGITVRKRDFTEGASGPVTEHGTAVAEVLAGRGRLGPAELFHAAVVGRVPDASPAAGVDNIMRAVDWLHESGVRLVNVSLAGPYNKILDRGLRAASDRGMIIVGAAGNDGHNAPPRYPAAFDYSIAVTAVDANLRPYQRAPRGNHIDFAAPGVDVFVPLRAGGRYMSGTSIAAPFVTAMIAADSATTGPGTVQDIRARLVASAIDLGSPGWDETFGAGLVTATGRCRSVM
jgi:hypothetical protein